MSSSGMMPPPKITIVTEPPGLHPLEDRGKERHVRAGEDGQADRVDVLLQRRFDDHLGRLVQARVDDLEARIAKRAGDDLGAAVVTVETRLGHEDAKGSLGHP